MLPPPPPCLTTGGFSLEPRGSSSQIVPEAEEEEAETGEGSPRKVRGWCVVVDVDVDAVSLSNAKFRRAEMGKVSRDPRAE